MNPSKTLLGTGAAAALFLCAFGQPGSAADRPEQQIVDQVDASSLDCLGSDYANLAPRANSAVHHSLLTTTQVIGAGSQTQIVMTHTNGVQLSTMRLKAFFVDARSVPDASTPTPSTEARVISDSLSDAEQKPIAAKLQIKEDDNALLQVDIPDSVSDGFYWDSTRTLVVVACTPGKMAPDHWAEAQVKVSSTLLPVAAAIAIDVLLYIFCGLVIRWTRNEITRQNMIAKAAQAAALASPGLAATGVTLPIGRLEEVKPWPYWRSFNPVAMTSDIFDKGNLGNLQILFFTLLVAYGLLYVVFRSGELSSISPTVVGLLGISAIGSLGAKVVGTNKDRLSTENWAWLVGRGVLPINDPGKGTPSWRDLLMSDSELDLYKLQALVFSLIVGLGMIAGGFSLATFSVPTELLEVLGLSQAVFVGGRAVKPASLGDLDVLLTELQARESALRKAAITGFDVDNTGTPVATASAGAPFRTMAAANATGAVPNAAQRYLNTLFQVKILLDAWSHRDIKTDKLKDPPLT